MTTIGFVRHGVTAWNKEGRAQGSSDIPLDEEGIEMAEHVASRLETESWDVIYTSHLLRAKKTAEIIAEKKPTVELYVDERLRELSGGQVEGTTEAERIQKWGESWRELELGFRTTRGSNRKRYGVYRGCKNKASQSARISGKPWKFHP